MNYFSQPKGARDLNTKEAVVETPRPEAGTAKPKQETLSTFGAGMLITGDVVCTGALQIFGRITGEIHAGKVIVCDGAKVEGKIRAQDVVIQGEFIGTVHANSVKLQSSAKVDGEIFNKQLAIEQNALFEGVSRRLERPIEPPSADQVSGAKAALADHTGLTPRHDDPMMLARPAINPVPLSEVSI